MKLRNTKFVSLIVLGLSICVTSYAGKTGTWSGSDTHKWFPTIVKALLGNGYYLVPSQVLFGDCSDGDVTISAGTTTLTRDMYYNNLTINGTGILSVQNQRVFVCGTLDLTAAPAGAITGAGNNGGNGAAGGGAGAAGATLGVGTNLTGRAGTAGGAGATTAGAQAGAASGGSVVTGAAGASGGAGGAGGGGAGGAQRNQTAVTNFPMRDIFTWYLPLNGAGTQIFVSGGAAGGSGGGGDGTSSGGGGGGGGASGQTVYLSVNILKTGVSTVASTITVNGGNGGNGGSPNGTCTLGCGGGGGGGAGAGGWAVVKYNSKVGAAVTNLITATVGATATGGTHKNAGGVDGANGSSTAAVAGLIQTLNLSTGAYTASTSGNASL